MPLPLEQDPFVLDAMLGVVNLEQNNIIKLFSVMAVVLMPPSLSLDLRHELQAHAGAGMDIKPAIRCDAGDAARRGLPYMLSSGSAGL